MYDLIVVGGGLTGVAASCAAAKDGLSVLLIEKDGFLGGAACNSYVNPFMPYHVTLNGERHQISDGMFSEILGRLEEKGGLMENKHGFNEEILKLVLDDMAEDYGVTVLFHSALVSAEVEGESVKSISVVNKSGVQKYEAKYFVDATGDADLAVMSGCGYRLGRDEDNLCQPMTLCFRISDIDEDKLNKEVWQEAGKKYQALQAEGKIINPREDILKFPHVAKGVIHFNTTRVIKKSPVDAFAISETERLARRQVFEMYNFLKENVPGFENCVLLASAPKTGTRESRMIEGEYTINQMELKDCVKFDDAIAACNYDIDIHSPDGGGTSHYYFKENEYYTIPYRCMVPKGKDNLLVAGRCISSTHEAQASYRIMPVCCTLGEAAGTAVAVCSENNTPTNKADVKTVQKKLKENGAFF